MREPILDVALPSQLAVLARHYRSGDAEAEKLVIVQQVYDDVGQQLTLLATCVLFVENAGVRFIAVEGADTELQSDARRPSVTHLVERTANDVSAGVLSLLNGTLDIEAWGIDDLELKRRSEIAQMRVMSVWSERDQAFAEIRRLLRTARGRWYPPEFSRLREALVLVGVHGDRTSLAALLSLVKEGAASSRVDVRAFPVIITAEDISKLEDRIDLKRARKEWASFIERILNRMHAWYRPAGANQVKINLEKAQPLIEYWMEATQLTAEEFNQLVELRGLEDVLRSCKQWFDAWAFQKAIRHAHSGPLGNAEFNEELMRLALRIDVRYFDLSHYREFVALSRMRDTARLDRLKTDISVCCRTIVDKLHSQQAARLLEVEEGLHELYLALGLEMGPDVFEISDVRSGKLIPLLGDLCELSGVPLPGQVESVCNALDGMVDTARELMQCSRSRGQHMARRTIELMRERGEDRAILVVGGFHTRAVTRMLEEYGQVSWSVVSPRFDAKAYQKQPAGTVR